MQPCRSRWSLGHLLFVALVGSIAFLAHVVDGYGWCQEYWNWDGKRNSSDGRRWPAADGVVITYINGIFHTVPEWKSITHQLQAMFGHEVRPFYNPSSGWWITDASKAGYHMLRKPANDTIAQALGDHLAQAVEDVGRGRVLHIAHSGGALITYLAAQHHLTERQRDKIDVLSFGGAHSITRKYFSGRVVNYYARNDPLVKLDRRAAELMKLTNDTRFQEVNEKHNTTFVFLEGRARQFVLDHSLEGPTYQHALRKEAKAFRRAHFGPLSPLSWDYESSLLRLARKKFSQLSGSHEFFSTERFGLRYMRKAIARITGFHGFFSGKMLGTGSRLVVVKEAYEDEPPLGHSRKSSGLTGGVSRLMQGVWPWGEPDGENILVEMSESEENELGGKEASGDESRFWLKFRFFPRSNEEDEQKVEVANGKADGRELVKLDEGDGHESRWVGLRGIWGFQRNATSEAASVSDSGGKTMDAQEAEEAKEQIGAVDNQTSPRVEERPWLSVGWTPWGARSVSKESGGDGDESGDTVDGEHSEGNGKAVATIDDESAVMKMEEQSFLKSWWPISIGSLVGRDAAQSTGAEDEDLKEAGQKEDDRTDGEGKVDGRDDRVDEAREQQQQHGETIVEAPESGSTSAQEGQSLLPRWWPFARSVEDVAVSVTPAASKPSEHDERREKGLDDEGRGSSSEIAVTEHTMGEVGAASGGAVVSQKAKSLTGSPSAEGVGEQGLEPAAAPTDTTPTEAPVLSRLWPFFAGADSPSPSDGADASAVKSESVAPEKSVEAEAELETNEEVFVGELLVPGRVLPAAPAEPNDPSLGTDYGDSKNQPVMPRHQGVEASGRERDTRSQDGEMGAAPSYRRPEDGQQSIQRGVRAPGLAGEDGGRRPLEGLRYGQDGTPLARRLEGASEDANMQGNDGTQSGVHGNVDNSKVQGAASTHVNITPDMDGGESAAGLSSAAAAAAAVGGGEEGVALDPRANKTRSGHEGDHGSSNGRTSGRLKPAADAEKAGTASAGAATAAAARKSRRASEGAKWIW